MPVSTCNGSILFRKCVLMSSIGGQILTSPTWNGGRGEGGGRQGTLASKTTLWVCALKDIYDTRWVGQNFCPMKIFSRQCMYNVMNVNLWGALLNWALSWGGRGHLKLSSISTALWTAPNLVSISTCWLFTYIEIEWGKQHHHESVHLSSLI